MSKIVKLSVTLFLICAIACGVLGFTNEMTAPRIAVMEAEAAQQARSEVMPAADDISEKVSDDLLAEINEVCDGKIEEAYVAKKGGEVCGYTFQVKENGFGGSVTVMVGIDNDGNVTGMRVTKHSETAGLGAKSTTDEHFIHQYEGKNASENLKVVKDGGDIDALTGATITSRAVTRAVNYAGQAFLTIKEAK